MLTVSLKNLAISSVFKRFLVPCILGNPGVFNDRRKITPGFPRMGTLQREKKGTKTRLTTLHTFPYTNTKLGLPASSSSSPRHHHHHRVIIIITASPSSPHHQQQHIIIIITYLPNKHASVGSSLFFVVSWFPVLSFSPFNTMKHELFVFLDRLWSPFHNR